MSTRSAVARWNDTKWVGVYVHFDGYPTHRGPILWRLLHDPQNADGDVDRLCRFLIDEHPNGWSSLNPRMVEEGFTDRPEHPGCVYYDREGDGPMPQTWEHNDPLFIEWVWAFDAERRRLHILASHDSGCTETREGYGGGTHEAPLYEHYHVTELDLDGPEPDWEAIESREDREFGEVSA